MARLLSDEAAVSIVESLSGKRVPPELLWLARTTRCQCNPVLLDIGSGKGYKLLLLALMLRPPYTLIGVDLNVQRIKWSRRLLEEHGVAAWVEHVVADAHHLPIRDFAVDALLLWNILMFVASDERVVDEAWRVARGGALLLVSTYRVKNARRNYSFHEVHSLVSRRFEVVNGERLSSNQVKIIGVKREYAVELSVERDQECIGEFVERALSRLGLKPTGRRVKLVVEVRDPRLEAIVSEARRRLPGFVARRTNLVSFAYLHEVRDPLEHVRKAVEKLYEQGCVYSSQRVIDVLAEVVGSKGYAEKLANDLVRLGVLTYCKLSSPPLTLCAYTPSIRVLGYARLTLEPDNLPAGLRESLLYNPLLHRIALDVESRGIEARHTAYRLVRRYWAVCLGYTGPTLEVQRLLEPGFFARRVVRPLVKLGVVSARQFLGEKPRELVALKHAAYVGDELERLL